MLKKNLIYNIIYQLFAILLPLLTMPYVAHVFGTSGNGLYASTSTVAMFFIVFGMLGFSWYGNRQIALNKKNKQALSKEFWNIYSLQFIMTSITTIIYLFIFIFIIRENQVLYLAQSIMIIAAMIDITWFFYGYEDMQSIIVRNSIVKIICTASIFIFIKDENDLVKYALIMAGAGFLGQAIMWLNLKNKIIFVKPNFKEIIQHFKPSLAFFTSNLAIKIYVYLDILMLTWITNNSDQVGLYDMSKKITSLAIAIVSALGMVIMPKMSRLFAENKLDDFKAIIYKSFGFVNFFAIPMTIGIIGIANNFSQAFLADKFDGISPILIIASLLIILIGWSNVLGTQVLLPMRQDKQFIFSTILGAVLNIVINLIVISNFQSLGAIISCVLSEVAVTAVQFYFLRDILEAKKILMKYKTLKSLFLVK